MEKHFKIHLYYATVAIVLLISIIYVSIMPSDKFLKTEINHLDKIVHFSMYFILSSFMVLGFSNLNHKKIFIKAIPILLSFFCSFFIELLQELVTSSRLFEIFDILANGMGCMFAFLILKTQFFNKLKI